MHVQKIEGDGATLPDRLVSRVLAAQFLGLSPATLATWASAGCGPKFTKLSAGRSGCVRYRLSDLERFVSDPQSHRPRIVAPFNRPNQSPGNPRLSVAKARKRRNGKARR